MESLFQDKFHFFLFWFYIGLFVNQGILITASKESDGSYNYNTTTIVLLTEIVKLCLAIFLYLRNNEYNQLLIDIGSSGHVFVRYLIPSFLYCLYNNLAFINLKHYDPTSYFLLLNFRTATTGIIFQLLFNKLLSRRQWMALLLLTAGCIVKQIRLDKLNSIQIEMDIHLALMMIQVFCSCFAGVYNEYLLKNSKSVDVPLMVQNMYMYFDSILINMAFLAFKGQLASAVTPTALSSVFRISVLSIALNNGLAGITTSFFLKQLNSIMKIFAGAIELILTAVVARILFGIEIGALMLVSIGLVSWAMYLYSTNPVINKGASEKTEQLMEKEEYEETKNGIEKEKGHNIV